MGRFKELSIRKVIQEVNDSYNVEKVKKRIPQEGDLPSDYEAIKKGERHSERKAIVASKDDDTYDFGLDDYKNILSILKKYEDVEISSAEFIIRESKETGKSIDSLVEEHYKSKFDAVNPKDEPKPEINEEEALRLERIRLANIKFIEAQILIKEDEIKANKIFKNLEKLIDSIGNPEYIRINVDKDVLREETAKNLAHENEAEKTTEDHSLDKNIDEYSPDR